MKRILVIISILIAAVLSAAFAPKVSAELKSVEGIMYKINPEGITQEKYTGWGKSVSTGKRFYYKDGIKLSGVHLFPDNYRYVFNENGVYLGRRSLKGTYSVIFDNNYNINTSDGEISFNVKINNMQGKQPRDFEGDPLFLLYVYKDGNWDEIPYIDDVVFIFDMVETNENDNIIGRFSQKLSMFNYEFKPGLYRVTADIFNGEQNKKTATGEFNLL